MSMSVSRSLLATTRRKAAVVVGAGVLLLGGGVAYAYWSSTGTGSGAAETGSAPAFVVASDPATGDPLTPGGPAQSVAFSVTNPSTGVLNLASVLVTVANADGTTWTAGPTGACSAADYSVGTPAITYGPIAAGAAANGSVTIAMVNRSANQDECKNVTVPLYFAAS
ncbi:hypothetical protein JL107_01775 [Nakamurella flavida]|uniref:Uncharacterized protein n=1 Tax=Nakamurella flavida TaxID=363630 RepID=A0A938YHG2_9ACTN|nr:hypothetical protein [Nakamurella flavida]MBM9475164.1 hypothetical protein [Nakamurella flavida]MDP9776737.1 hypothetical protein [Nakamurella flavida]